MGIGELNSGLQTETNCERRPITNNSLRARTFSYSSWHIVGSQFMKQTCGEHLLMFFVMGNSTQNKIVSLSS